MLLTSSCTNNKDEQFDLKSSCDVDNPLTELAWLKTTVEELEQSDFQHTIVKARYNNETVFVIYTCCSNCSYIIPVYNCEGEQLGVVGSQNDNIPPDALKDSEELWRSEKDCS